MAFNEINAFKQIISMPTVIQEKTIRKKELSRLKKDVTVICDYLWEEEKHYEESGRPRDHIWLRVKSLRRWLKNSSSHFI